MQPSKKAGRRMMSRVGRLFVVGAQGQRRFSAKERRWYPVSCNERIDFC